MSAYTSGTTHSAFNEVSERDGVERRETGELASKAGLSELPDESV